MKLYIKPISKAQLKQYMSVEDLSDDSNHAIGQMYLLAENLMKEIHTSSEIRKIKSSPIVPVEDNYGRLLIPKDSISRSSTYTHYVTKDTVLRAHTTAQIPNILADLSQDTQWNDLIIMLPGLVYRRDVTDRKHLGIIHQLEIWRIKRNNGEAPITRTDLLNTITRLAKAISPDWKIRAVDKIHPYTRQGVEINLVKDNKDIEILEGGVIHEQILTNAGLNPKEYSGWAMGMGLDRVTMIKKEIPDIRYLRSTNPKIAIQMHNLEKYKEVSLQPAIVRDISYCVPANYVEEDISNGIKDALGINSDVLESVDIQNQAIYNDLDQKLREKLGCTESMKNVLVRITLRDLNRTLTKQEANEMYSLIYMKVNYGNAVYS